MSDELLAVALVVLYAWWVLFLYVWARRQRIERDAEAICLGIASGFRKGLQGSEVAPAGGNEPAPADKV